jgi:hypothetical protein
MHELKWKITARFKVTSMVMINRNDPLAFPSLSLSHSLRAVQSSGLAFARVNKLSVPVARRAVKINKNKTHEQ